jgi:hypothetical protein
VCQRIGQEGGLALDCSILGSLRSQSGNSGLDTVTTAENSAVGRFGQSQIG